MNATASAITKDLIAQHNLTDDEYQKIVEILGREPNLTELGMFSVMWSEHCSYKSSRVHSEEITDDRTSSSAGARENAGAVDIGDGLCAVFKMESHNHPSFIEPYQGAATGVGGIYAIFYHGRAGRSLLLDSLRFGELETAKNRHLVKGVVAGIAGYGNCMGVPTVGGEIVFNESIRRTRWSTCFVSVSRTRIRFFSERRRGRQSGDLFRLEDGP